MNYHFSLMMQQTESYILDSISTNTNSSISTNEISQKQESLVMHLYPKTYNFTVAICVIMKDADMYFEEWLDYHLAMGFDAIYVYDNSQAFELKNWYHNTRKHATYSRVQVVHWAEYDSYTQNLAYRNCVAKYGQSKTGPKNDYFAFIDVDEFLVIRSTDDEKNKYMNIQSILADYLVPYGGALTVNWMMVGSANKTIASPLPVTKRFQYRDKETHGVVKSFAKTSDYLGHKNPHAVTVRRPATVLNTKYPGSVAKQLSESGASDGDRPSDVLLLYHFRYCSEKEYVYKRCIRGEAAGNSWCDDQGNGVTRKGTPTHIQPAPGEVFDDSPWQFLKSRVPKYRVFDEFEDYHHEPMSNISSSTL